MDHLQRSGSSVVDVLAVSGLVFEVSGTKSEVERLGLRFAVVAVPSATFACPDPDGQQVAPRYASP